MLRLEFYGQSSSPDKVDALLSEVRKRYGISVRKQPLEEGGKALKSSTLLALAVANRIAIKQTRRKKTLYPQLVVFEGKRPLTFYPQARRGSEIEIAQFLRALLRRKVLCLHDDGKLALEAMLARSRKAR